MLERVAVTLFNGLGDGILARPLLAALRHRAQRVDLYCLSGQERDVFGGLEVNTYPVMAGAACGPRGPLPNLWISLNAYQPIPLESQFCCEWQCAERRGFIGKSIFGQRLPMRDQYFATAGIAEKCQLRDAPPHVSAAAEKRASRWLGGSPNRSLCILHGDSLAEKMWPLSRWKLIVNELRKMKFDIVACGEAIDFWQPIPEVRCAAPELELTSQIALVRRADVFVGIDSVFMHVSDAFEKRGVALFGPSDQQVWGPGSERFRIVGGHDGTMNSILENEVCDALHTVISMGRS